MNYMVWLNRSITDAHHPLFEIVYGLEVVCLICCLILGPIMMYVSFNSQPLHRNMRINFTNGMMRVTIASAARLVLLYHQYFHDEPTIWLLIATCAREAFINFFVAAYEKESLTTAWVFVANDILLDGVSIIHTICFVWEYITIYTNVLVLVALLAVSAMSFVVLYRFNLKELSHMKKGAQVNSYSIARSFQIRENIAVLQMLLRVAFPTVIFNGPAFFFFFVYLLTPIGCGYDWVKHLGVAFFDLWIGVYALSLVSLMRYEPIFKRSFQRLKLLSFGRNRQVNPKPSAPRMNPIDEGDIYFKLFNMDTTKK